MHQHTCTLTLPHSLDRLLFHQSPPSSHLSTPPTPAVLPPSAQSQGTTTCQYCLPKGPTALPTPPSLPHRQDSDPTWCPRPHPGKIIAKPGPHIHDAPWPESESSSDWVLQLQPPYSPQDSVFSFSHCGDLQ